MLGCCRASKGERPLEGRVGEVAEERRDLFLMRKRIGCAHIESRDLSEEKIVRAAESMTRRGPLFRHGHGSIRVGADGGEHHLAKTLTRGAGKRRTLEDFFECIHVTCERIPERDRTAEDPHERAPQCFIRNDLVKLRAFASFRCRFGKARQSKERLVRVRRRAHVSHKRGRNPRESIAREESGAPFRADETEARQIEVAEFAFVCARLERLNRAGLESHAWSKYRRSCAALSR